MGGAWCYVPELKGFLLYGGYSPRFTNEGWLFDPAKCEMKLLWADDSLAYDDKGAKWRALMPCEIRWSQDRPGPARGTAAVYSPDTRKIYLFGGHPTERSWWGDTKLGTWELDPATLKFRRLGDSGPKGMTKAVYDSANRLIVVAPQRPSYARKKEAPATWVFDPAGGSWEKRTPACPRPGPHPGFAYDPETKKCVYFSAYGETWTYDAETNEWRDMKPVKAPPPRWHAAMAYVSALGGTVLHGGLARKEMEDPWREAPAAFRIKREGVQYTDTWVFDVQRNEWRELPGAGGPALSGDSGSARDLCAVDTDSGAMVWYDPSYGIWALGRVTGYKVGKVTPHVVVPKTLLEEVADQAAKRPELDAAILAWQRKIRELPDDSWLDPKVEKPPQGCISFGYQPEAGCIYWMGGCRAVTQGTYEDYKYNNQVIIFDMVTAKWFQRRTNHVWMPEIARNYRLGNGCGRAICYDNKRNVVWTLGGVTGFGLPGAHRIQSYDFETDRFSAQGSGSGGSDSGLVYDAKNDLVILVRGAYHPLDTVIFDPKTGEWRKGADHPPKFSQYTRVVADTKVGVVMVGAVPKAWKVGDRLPGEWKSWLKLPLVTRAYAYDAKTDKWRDLAATNAEKVPASTSPGVAYDPSRRTVLVFTSNATGASRQPVNVAVLDLEANRWEFGKDSPPLPAMNKGSAVFDARRNVVIIGAGHNLYLYRWKGGCPEHAFVDDARNRSDGTGGEERWSPLRP